MRPAAAIGFRLHTGWAILVAVSADGETPRVLHRCRIELLPAGVGRFVYHRAATLSLAEAKELIGSVRQIAEATARTAIQSAIANLDVKGVCIPPAAAADPDELEAVLRSHARIHSAEGALYAGAIAAACRQLGLALIAVRERDVWSRACEKTGMAEATLKAGIDGVRKSLGPPWTADHKIAMAAAICYRTGSVLSFEP